MQLHIDISRWLHSKQCYKSGIELFKKACGDEFYINLFESYENPFTRGKLEEMLQDWADNINTNNKVDDAVNISTDDNETRDTSNSTVDTLYTNSIPDVIINYKAEKGRLFKEVLEHRRIIKKTIPLNTKGWITLRNALKIMEQISKTGKSVPFSITYVTWNDSTHRGGEIICWKKAVLANLNLTGSRLQSSRKTKQLHSVIAKNPNHWKHGTRNINPEDSIEVRKLHIWLIFEFNGQEVLLSEPG